MPASVSRRAALGLAGLGTAAGVGLATGVGAITGSGTAGTPSAAAFGSGPSITVPGWRQARGAQAFVAHRGSGDVFPEHSLEAYRAALAWGAQCIEISVRMTSDGVLICLHDEDYDRTTTGTGPVAQLPSTVLRGLRLKTPQLGPAWDPGPRVPLLEEVLRAVGGRAVLAIEAKDDAAYPAMMALIASFGLTGSVIVKADRHSTRIAPAQSAGLPVFSYIGSPDELTPDAIKALGQRLHAESDVMVIPAYAAAAYIPDELVRAAVATGIPTWVYPIHRRVDVGHFAALGVVGFVTAGYGYVTTAGPVATRDTWAYGAISPGELTKDPNGQTWAMGWPGSGEVTLPAARAAQFLTLGQFSPVATPQAFQVELQARWVEQPQTGDPAVVLVTGHEDDSYYEPGVGRSTGYTATIGASGTLRITVHRKGSTKEKSLGESPSEPVPAGTWVPLRWQVSGATLTWTRTDTGASVSVQDDSARGGYLHLGRIGAGVAGYRLVVVKPAAG